MTETKSRFFFIGNTLCLDFVNTERMREGDRVDLLGSVDDLWDWFVESGAHTRAEVEALADLLPAEQVLREAKELRAALRRLAECLAGEDAVPRDIVDAVNEHLGRRRGAWRLARMAEKWGMEFHAEDAHGRDFLYAVAQSAAYLLANGARGLVRQCESTRCILYFYDTTKNHGRRWCSMEGCGNRHKAAEHYRRRRQTKESVHETLTPEKPL